MPIGQIVPMGTRADHPNNSIHEQSIISARPAWI